MTAVGVVRRILHVDMDAFFASVELLDRPELRGRPVVVGGTGPRGVVAAASYEARGYGVRSAMPSATARRLCPHAVFLDGRHARYREVSAEVMKLFGRVTPLVEPLSLDEAFLDVTGAIRALGAAEEIAARIRAEVAAEVGLSCSVGVASSKFLAKLASEQAKPVVGDRGPQPGPGVVVVAAGGELAFLHPLPVSALWGVGPATFAKLSRLGVSTVGDLAALPLKAVTAAVGDSVGRHLHELARGIDERPVVADQRPKSVSHEETFALDRTDRDGIRRELVRMADAVASRLRAAGMGGRTVQLKVRFGDFTTITRSHSVTGLLDDATAIWRIGAALLDEVDVGPGVRLVGLGVANLGEGAAEQLELDLSGATPSATATSSRHAANEAVDAIRARFGPTAIGPAALVGSDGLETFEAGSQQWGPTAE